MLKGIDVGVEVWFCVLEGIINEELLAVVASGELIITVWLDFFTLFFETISEAKAMATIKIDEAINKINNTRKNVGIRFLFI